MAGRHLPRGSCPKELPHHKAEIERGGLKKVALAYILLAAKPNASVLTGLADVSEGALDEFASFSL